MRNLFINLAAGRVSVATYRNPSAGVTDLKDILLALHNETEETLVCSAEGASDALCDGQWLADIGADQNAVEEVYNALQDAAK
jgi:hypothetical protein